MQTSRFKVCYSSFYVILVLYIICGFFCRLSVVFFIPADFYFSVSFFKSVIKVPPAGDAAGRCMVQLDGEMTQLSVRAGNIRPDCGDSGDTHIIRPSELIYQRALTVGRAHGDPAHTAKRHARSQDEQNNKETTSSGRRKSTSPRGTSRPIAARTRRRWATGLRPLRRGPP